MTKFKFCARNWIDIRPSIFFGRSTTSQLGNCGWLHAINSCQLYWDSWSITLYFFVHQCCNLQFMFIDSGNTARRTRGGILLAGFWSLARSRLRSCLATALVYGSCVVCCQFLWKPMGVIIWIDRLEVWWFVVGQVFWHMRVEVVWLRHRRLNVILGYTDYEYSYNQCQSSRSSGSNLTWFNVFMGLLTPVSAVWCLMFVLWTV